MIRLPRPWWSRHVPAPPLEPFGEEVDHCNRRTEYEMISHTYQPETCKECERIRDLFR